MSDLCEQVAGVREEEEDAGLKEAEVPDPGVLGEQGCGDVAAPTAVCEGGGRSTTGRSSFGVAFVAGRKRVPRPATGKIAVRTF